MTTPNFNPVSFEELLEHTDSYAEEAGAPGAIRRWVDETNAVRAADKAHWEFAPFELAGIPVKPGDLVTLTIKGGSNPTRRLLNCLVIDRIVTESYNNRRFVNVRIRRYGAKPDGGYRRMEHLPVGTVVGVEIIDPIPPAIQRAIESDEAQDRKWGKR